MSSVVLPGLTAFPPSSRACAAIRQASRIASIDLRCRTPSPVSRFGAFLSTYSGRAMEEGQDGAATVRRVSTVHDRHSPSLRTRASHRFPARFHWFAPTPRGAPHPRARKPRKSCRHLASSDAHSGDGIPGTDPRATRRVTVRPTGPHPPIRGDAGCLLAVDVPFAIRPSPRTRRSDTAAVPAAPSPRPRYREVTHTPGSATPSRQRPDLRPWTRLRPPRTGRRTTTDDQLGHPGAKTGPSVTERGSMPTSSLDMATAAGKSDVDLVRPHRTHLGVGLIDGASLEPWCAGPAAPPARDPIHHQLVPQHRRLRQRTHEGRTRYEACATPHGERPQRGGICPVGE